jgi:hypothetical protein
VLDTQCGKCLEIRSSSRQALRLTSVPDSSYCNQDGSHTPCPQNPYLVSDLCHQLESRVMQMTIKKRVRGTLRTLVSDT